MLRRFYMARKQSRDKKNDNMSVLGENYPVSALPGVYPCRLHEASWFGHDQSFDCRRAIKRSRGSEEEYLNELSLPKKFVSEEIVASHLQQLNLTSNTTNNTPTPPSPLHVTTANTTATSSDTLLPSSQTPTHSSHSSLSSVPLLTSLDLLASAARTYPLSIKTVASCPRSLETNKDEMVCDEEKRVTTDATSDDAYVATSSQSSSGSNYSTVVTSTQLIDVEPGSRVYQTMRTSPGHHKRPACVLDEEGDGEESEERIEDTDEVGEGGRVLSSGAVEPYTKRSKVDVRVTSANDFMSCSALPLSLPLSRDQLQGMISDESSPSCSSTDSSEPSGSSSDNNGGSGDRTAGTVMLEDGSDSSDGGQEPGPEKPLSVWLSPELQALSRQQSLLPPAIWEKLHTPKGMELVPWVGGPSLLAKIEENQQEQQQEQLSTDSPPMESSGEAESQTLLAPEGQKQQQQQWTIAASEDNLHDVIMEP